MLNQKESLPGRENYCFGCSITLNTSPVNINLITNPVIFNDEKDRKMDIERGG